jgi:hypothetical protein
MTLTRYCTIYRPMRSHSHNTTPRTTRPNLLPFESMIFNSTLPCSTRTSEQAFSMPERSFWRMAARGVCTGRRLPSQIDMECSSLSLIGGGQGESQAPSGVYVVVIWWLIMSRPDFSSPDTRSFTSRRRPRSFLSDTTSTPDSFKAHTRSIRARSWYREASCCFATCGSTWVLWRGTEY